MTRKQRRAVLIVAGLALIGSAVGLAGYALRQNVTFFMSPTDILTNMPAAGTRIRLGGLVEAGSFHKISGTDANVTFRVTDGAKSLPVAYSGILPDLFKEGQGTVAEGVMAPDGVFKADTVLAKHDEKYMPPEVTAALKKGGYWQEQNGKSKAKAAPGT
jgi:cytochrome c-type biogenesis protein CcmE